MAVRKYEIVTSEIIEGRLLNYRTLQRMSSKELAEFIGAGNGLVTVDKEIIFRIENVNAVKQSKEQDTNERSQSAGDCATRVQPSDF